VGTAEQEATGSDRKGACKAWACQEAAELILSSFSWGNKQLDLDISRLLGEHRTPTGSWSQALITQLWDQDRRRQIRGCCRLGQGGHLGTKLIKKSWHRLQASGGQHKLQWASSALDCWARTTRQACLGARQAHSVVHSGLNKLMFAAFLGHHCEQTAAASTQKD